jgi:hypothetical protein
MPAAHQRLEQSTVRCQAHQHVSGRFAEDLDVAARRRIVGEQLHQLVLLERLRQEQHRHRAGQPPGI